MSQTANTIANYGNQLISMRFSREHEKEADFAGLDYLERAGYQPQAIVETMEILNAKSKTKPIQFFSTHPNPENRKEYLEYKIKRRGYTGSKRIGKEDYKQKILNNLPKEK
jgi:predicted Zn-dependent protease